MTMNLTLDESAEYLTKRTTLGNVEQCRKKLIEKALAGEIEISVRLPKGTLGMHGVFKKNEEIDSDRPVSTSLFEDGDGPPMPWTPPLVTTHQCEGGSPVGLIQDCRFEFTGEAMTPIIGVFDLLMFGLGAYLVEQLLNKNVILSPYRDLGGIYVKRPSDGSIFELQIEGQVKFGKNLSISEQQVEEPVSTVGPEVIVMAPAGSLPAESAFIFRRDILNNFLELYSPLAAKQGEAPLPPLNRSRFKTPGFVTGKEELTRVFGVGRNSMTSVRCRVKKAGYTFDKDPTTNENRLTQAIVNDILAMKATKKK
jgi:hypothetical protein